MALPQASTATIATPWCLPSGSVPARSARTQIHSSSTRPSSSKRAYPVDAEKARLPRRPRRTSTSVPRSHVAVLSAFPTDLPEPSISERSAIRQRRRHRAVRRPDSASSGQAGFGVPRQVGRLVWCPSDEGAVARAPALPDPSRAARHAGTPVGGACGSPSRRVGPGSLPPRLTNVGFGGLRPPPQGTS